jgi:hypothetical protein
MSLKKNSPNSDLGYWFSMKRYPHSPGHPRLTIVISNIASDLHFDPKVIQLPVFTSIDELHPHGIEHMKISHPWTYHTSFHVAPGMLIISDRKGKKVEAFTFGGKLEIYIGDDNTKCVIESDAPIIEVGMRNVLIMKLVEEAEILLAERRAVWAQDEIGFSKRLENIPPDVLYAAFLQEFLDGIDRLPSKDIQAIRDFRTFVVDEKQSLLEEERWPKNVPSISEIL